MDMLVLGIVVPYNNIGLLPIAHLHHVFPGDFMEGRVIKVFPMGKVQGNVGIAVLGGIALPLEMEYAPEELLGYVPRVHVPVTEYAHALLAEHIVQYALTAFPV
jgi:hypothetical protein